MAFDDIKTGNRVEIYLVSEKDDNFKYTSLVEKNYGNGKLLLYIPMMYGKIIRLPAGNEYLFVFVTETGMIKYQAVISDYIYEDDFNFMLVEIVSEIEKIQRREFFRFDCVLPLRFINTDHEGKEKDDCFFEGTVRDLGEGGIKFLSNAEIEVDSKIKFFITLNFECAASTGIILQRQEYPKSDFKYQYRAQFQDLNDDEKDKILKYIFFEQRFKARKDRETFDMIN